MQIAQRVPAHEATIASEGDVAFENAGAHARASHCSLDRLFGELKRAAATMANAEVGDGEGTVLASLKLVLEGRFRHVVDNVIGSGSERDVVVDFRCWSLCRSVARPLRQSSRNIDQQCRKGQITEGSTHVGRLLQV